MLASGMFANDASGMLVNAGMMANDGECGMLGV